MEEEVEQTRRRAASSQLQLDPESSGRVAGPSPRSPAALPVSDGYEALSHTHDEVGAWWPGVSCVVITPQRPKCLARPHHLARPRDTLYTEARTDAHAPRPTATLLRSARQRRRHPAHPPAARPPAPRRRCPARRRASPWPCSRPPHGR
eukprot:scaffold109036_cov47-Phaeocystis_antarctica.AAC.1